MTTRDDLQYEQDWNLDSPATGKAAYYAPVMSPPWDMEKFERNLQYWGEQFKKDQEAREQARPDLYKKPDREWRK